MICTNDLFRKIPKADYLLSSCYQSGLKERFGTSCIRESLQEVLSDLRKAISEGRCTAIPEVGDLVSEIEACCEVHSRSSLRPVINATGVILHTNLGRSVLSRKAADAVFDAATGYSTVEYDIAHGSRGSRYIHVESLLTKLCECEAAMVVNNNAAAVLLMLSEIASGREVIVSRGELVEIGGSFRMPDIMALSGSVLREIGTTNKTHPADYEKVIGENTAALLKVHTSNFVISGFTESVGIREMVSIAHRHGLPALYDLGSGILYPMSASGLETEPTVRDAIRAGADLVSFSGDKLLGGPQAGLIVGCKAYIDRLKANPLMRALRCDKLTLAALEATLRIYLEPEQADYEIPTRRMLLESPDIIAEKARQLYELLLDIPEVCIEIVADSSMAGGGSLPGKTFPTTCVAVLPKGLSANAVEKALRMCNLPVIARIRNNRCLLDMRTVTAEEIPLLAESIRSLSKNGW